ncbi:serine hydrolase domain-containing protein [Kribbella antibiotica]|uniref:serine hydrolase domain-containing protein n=1 Tax=Kribbella antibiotica TaxID=190195 RepID=UPI001EDF058B|nr:serine hydrolase [Kribbella antibiotica]
MSSLPRSTPDSQGLSAASLDAFVAALDRSAQEFHTVTLVRHGHIVLEAEWAPYRLTDQHLLYSVSKSFTSTAIGLAADAGLLSIDDKVVSFFGPEDLPETISDNLAAMSVRHLLTMSTGHSQDTVETLSRDSRMVRRFLSLEVENEPGSPFVYNSGATYMLSAILQKVSGETLLEYLQTRLFAPLGITEATWGSSKEGITFGGWGLSLSAESLAKFGQLMLQRGVWEGQQLVSAEWFEAATSKQVSNASENNPDSQQGYGFQIWRGRHNTYRADGAFGQFILVLPEHDAVLAVTSAASDMQAELELFWEHLLPALDGKEVPVVARPEQLELPAPSGSVPQGGDGTTYTFKDNPGFLESVRWDADGSAYLTFFNFFKFEQDKAAEDGYGFAAGDWHEQPGLPSGGVAGTETERVVTSAAGDGDTLVGTIRWLAGPHAAEFRCRISEGRMTVDVRLNVSFAPLEFTIVSEPAQ